MNGQTTAISRVLPRLLGMMIHLHGFVLIFCTLRVIELLVSHAPSSRHICTIQDGTMASPLRRSQRRQERHGGPRCLPPAAQMGSSSTNTEEEDRGPSLGVLWGLQEKRHANVNEALRTFVSDQSGFWPNGWPDEWPNATRILAQQKDVVMTVSE